MYSFHQKNLFCTQTFDKEKIKRGKGRTSCFCISWSINPKHLYFSSQSALGISLGRSQKRDTPHSTAQSQHWLMSRGLQKSAAHSTFFRMPPCCQPRFHLCCHPTPQPTMPVLYRPSPVEPCTKDETKRKGQTATTLP